MNNIELKGKLSGDNIYLRKIEMSDVNQAYCDWMNDPEVIQFLETRFEKWTIIKTKDYVCTIKDNCNYLFLAIVSNKNQKHIGNIKLGPINKNNNFADIGIMIGEKDFWGKGIAAEAIMLLVDYAFRNLRLHKLTAGACKDNYGSIKAFQKAGFKIEGVRKEQCFFDGKYIDAVLLGIVNKRS